MNASNNDAKIPFLMETIKEFPVRVCTLQVCWEKNHWNASLSLAPELIETVQAWLMEPIA